MAKSVAGELFRFGVGAATARSSGVATAGTPGSISPTIRDRFRGGVEALSATQALRAGEATIERTQTQSELNRASIDKASQDVIDKGTQVDLSKVLGVNFTPKRTKEILDFARQRFNADKDGSGVVDAKEFAEVLPKIMKEAPDFIESTISSGTQEARLVLEQNTALIEPLIKKAQEVVPGLTVDNAAEMFQNNPNLATTFPKIAEALQGQVAQQQKIDNLNQAGEQAKLFAQSQAAPTLAERSPSIRFGQLMTLGTPESIKEANEMLRFKREGLATKGDRELLTIITRGLPERQKEARVAVNGNRIVDRVLDLINSGDVTGTKGQLRAFAAGFADLFDVSQESLTKLNNAQLFQRLGRLVTGSKRLEIIGPGPVSDFEQGIIERLAGGGRTAQLAARELFEFYRSLNDEKIELFNLSIDNGSKLNPNIRNIFNKIELSGGGTEKEQLAITQDTTPQINQSDLQARREALLREKAELETQGVQ